ncbi:MAG: winged helix-turn-helix domain-containing protein [Candidatus Bathyarchaeia archaeon]
MGVVLEKFPLINKECAFSKKYRSSFEIIAAILEVAIEKVTRFVIASRLNTNYMQLRKYLSYLVRAGFIDVEVGGKQILYKTSEKGLEFLRLYNALLEMLLEGAETRVHTSAICGCFSRQTTVKAKGKGRRGFGL